MLNLIRNIVAISVLIALLILSNSTTTPEERGFRTDVYKNYTIVDKQLTYIEAGEVFGTITEEVSGIDNYSDLKFRKINDVPTNEFVAGIKAQRGPYFSPTINLYRSPDCKVNPLTDWKISSIQIIENGTTGGIYHLEYYGKGNIISSTSEEELLRDVLISAQGLTEVYSYADIGTDSISRPHLAIFRLTFEEYPSIVWDANLVKFNNGYLLEINNNGSFTNSKGNVVDGDNVFLRLCDNISKYIDSVKLK